MTKKFIVELSDDATELKLRGLLYLGNESDHVDAAQYSLNVVNVSEVTYEENRLTFEQRESLWNVCGRYRVPFNEADYPIDPKTGVAEGWIGGGFHNGLNDRKKTIYMGVERNGNSHT